MKFRCAYIVSLDLCPPRVMGYGPIRDTAQEAENDGKAFISKCDDTLPYPGMPLPICDPTSSRSFRIEPIDPTKTEVAS